MKSIEARALCKNYGTAQVLQNVDFTIQKGELFTILGPSGSGKTTLLSLMAGLTEPSSGQILFDEKDVTHIPPAGRDVGLVFQSYALFPNMNVFENIAFPLSIRKVPKAEIQSRVARALDMVRLKGVTDRRTNQLSGGQQQRVALARALVFQPGIVLLDEPLGALDRQLREHLQVELKELQRALGVTMVLVTHDQEEALSLSDRLLLIDKGQVQQIATPTDAYLRPANRFVAEFLGIANFVRGPDDVELLLRPERLQVLPDTGQQDSGKAGRVRQMVYLGQAARIHVVLDDGREMVAAISSSDPAVQLSTNDRIRLHWNPADAWRLPS